MERFLGDTARDSGWQFEPPPQPTGKRVLTLSTPAELSHWMNRKKFSNLGEVRGLLAAPDAKESEAHERADYVWALRKANSGIYDIY